MVLTPHSRQNVQSIAQLFITLWKEIGILPSYHRSTSITPDKNFVDEVNEALESALEQDALDGVIKLLDANKQSSLHELGGIIAVMQAIDEFFYRIHPRAVILPSAVASRPNIPIWLKESRDNRYLWGHYGQDNESRLVPRGPLLRTPREERASSAESLADRFAALAVVEQKLKQENQHISIKSIFIGADIAGGVVAGPAPGEEKIAFIPIAEHANDLLITENTISNQKFADFRINSVIDAADRLTNALSQIVFSDIAIAPELVMSEVDADKLPEKLLLSFKTQPARMIVSGSGPTKLTDNGLPWNELRVFNGLGKELWRQRKIWTAGLNRNRAAEYGLSDPGEKLIKEYNAEGNEIIVADADGLGRCVVFICQDIQSQPLSAELIRQFQPDWVIIPILDPGIKIGKWGHQRTFSLSDLSQARFLIASSTTLARKLTASSKEPICGLAVGPKSNASNDEDRVYKAVKIIKKSSPGYAIVHWRNGAWKQTTVS